MSKITFNQAKKFLDEITLKNKVAIITDNDADGFTSGILFHKFLENKKINHSNFLANHTNLSFKNYNLKRFDTIIIADLAPSLISKDLQLIKHKKVFYTDHHPKDAQIPKQILEYRTKSGTSSAKTTYNLTGGNELLEAMANSVDAGRLQKENQKIIKKFAQKNKITLQQFNKNIMYKITRTIDYFHKKPAKVFKILSQIKSLKDINKLNKYDRIIGKEIKKHVKQYKSKKQKIRNINFFYFKPKFPIKSSIINEISYAHPKQTYIFATPTTNKKISISARNQTKKINMAQLLKTGIKNLKNANAGGHIPAAGATIQLKDLNQFKQNLKKYTQQ